MISPVQRDEMDSLKRRLDELRPISAKALAQLEQHYDVQLTYTSNAIEGNTLTYGETAMVIEKGITVGGKSINDHLEALDLYEATRFIRRAVAAETSTDEAFIVGLHARIVARSRPDIAGRYADVRRRIAGSDVIFPNPAKIPELMAHLGQKKIGRAHV